MSHQRYAFLAVSHASSSPFFVSWLAEVWGASTMYSYHTGATPLCLPYYSVLRFFWNCEPKQASPSSSCFYQHYVSTWCFFLHLIFTSYDSKLISSPVQNGHGRIDKKDHSSWEVCGQSFFRRNEMILIHYRKRWAILLHRNCFLAFIASRICYIFRDIWTPLNIRLWAGIDEASNSS